MASVARWYERQIFDTGNVVTITRWAYWRDAFVCWRSDCYRWLIHRGWYVVKEGDYYRNGCFVPLTWDHWFGASNQHRRWLRSGPNASAVHQWMARISLDTRMVMAVRGKLR